MIHLLLLVLTTSFTMVQTQSSSSGIPSTCSGNDITLDQFQWENRILVLFAQTSKNDSYQTQISKLSALEDELKARDLILISIFDDECSRLNGEIISDTSAESIRGKLSPSKNSYSIFLIGKDGGVKLKQDTVLEPEELFSVIDQMPMRQREMRDGD